MKFDEIVKDMYPQDVIMRVVTEVEQFVAAGGTISTEYLHQVADNVMFRIREEKSILRKLTAKSKAAALSGTDEFVDRFAMAVNSLLHANVNAYNAYARMMDFKQIVVAGCKAELRDVYQLEPSEISDALSALKVLASYQTHVAMA